MPKDRHMSLGKRRKLRQMYNHANVLHNVAWEAKMAWEKQVETMARRCRTKEEWQRLAHELDRVVHVDLDRLPGYPKPRRATSHSCDVDVIGIWTWHMVAEKGWNK